MHKSDAEAGWYEVREIESLPSPCVLVSRPGVIANIEAAIARAGGPERLRPHVKTHKSAQVVQLHLERGVRRFKCATPAEAEMLARAGVRDVLIAYQLVGPGAEILRDLIGRYPDTRFGCLVDNGTTLDQLEAVFQGYDPDQRAPFVLVDLDVGMHRTGIAPGDRADQLYRRITVSPCLKAGGIHAYDGHIREISPEKRAEEAAGARTTALEMRNRLQREGLPVPEVVLGGTPTFPCHADAYVEGCSLSPGTYSYHDWGYASAFADLPFRDAAVVLGRVVSVPEPGQFTIDVGSKGIAADKDQPRGMLLNVPDAEAGPQSEEHWVFTVPAGGTSSGKQAVAGTPAVGTPVYVWPRHICPTIEHYDEVLVVGEDRTVIERWPVTARGRALRRSE